MDIVILFLAILLIGGTLFGVLVYLFLKTLIKEEERKLSKMTPEQREIYKKKQKQQADLTAIAAANFTSNM